MKWVSFFLLGSACVCCQALALGQAAASSDLAKYPDIAYRERAFQLFKFLILDKVIARRIQPSGEEFQRMNREIGAIWLELIEAGVFIALDKPLREDRLAKLSPAARVFYDYYRQALPHNPVFRDPYTPVSDALLYSPYRSHQRQGRSEGERLAYEAAASVLDGPPKPNRTRYDLLAAGGAGLLASGGLALGVIHLRRRLKKRIQL